MMEPQRNVTKQYFETALKQYAPMINRLAISIGFNITQREELRSRASDELLKCMICYKNIGSFITFFYYRLSGVFRHMRDAECRANRIQHMSNDSMANMPTKDQDMDSHMMAQECLGCLDSEEYHVITELFFNHKTMREVASERGVFPSTVSRTKSRAMDKMRQKCGVELE